MMRFILSILIIASSALTGLSQVRDHQVILDPGQIKDSLYLFVSDTVPSSQYYGKGSWTKFSEINFPGGSGISEIYTITDSICVVLTSGDTICGFFDITSASNWIDVGDIIYPAENDTVYIPYLPSVTPPFFFPDDGTGVLNVFGRIDTRYPNEFSTNIAIGKNTLLALSAASDNVAIGHDALPVNDTGSGNVAIGTYALQNNTSGFNNFALGKGALGANVSGIGNVAIGQNAGGGLGTGQFNILIGDSAGFNETGSFKLYIEPSGSTEPLVFGDFAADTLHVHGRLGFRDDAGNATELVGRVGRQFTGVPHGAGLQIIDGVLSVIESDPDTIFGGGSDTLCFILMGDTTCVPLDSVLYFETEICFWVTPDTTCIPFSTTGLNIYNSNGALTDSRIVTIPSTNSLTFRRNETGGLQSNALQINNSGGTASVDFSLNSTSNTTAIIRLNNPNSGSNYIYQHWNGIGTDEDYVIGLDKAANSFIFAEGSNLSTGVPFMTYYGGLDSTVLHKDVAIVAGLIDASGSYGTAGQIPTSTGTGWEWDDAGGGGPIPINDLLDADGTNTIDNTNYAQEWQWSTLAGVSALKLSSASTAAASGAQRLLDVQLSGANATAGQTTTTGYFSNAHTGTVSANRAIHAIASGGSALNNAIFAEASGTNAFGVLASSSGTTGFGVIGITSGTNGIGVQGQSSSSTTSYPILGLTESDVTNTVRVGLVLERGGNTFAAPGYGVSQRFTADIRNFSAHDMNILESKWTDTTYASRTAQFLIRGAGSGSIQTLMTLDGNGQLTLNQYTTSNHNGGTAADSVLVITSAGVVKKRDAAAFGGGGGGGPIPINDLLDADATNTIDNADFLQEWQWNTLAAGSGLKLTSTSTLAASSTQRLFDVRLSGANATSGQTTYAGYFSNTHTGTTAINHGLYSEASGGGLFNYGIRGVGSTAGVLGEATGSGVGVSGISSSGRAVYGSSGSGTAVYGTSSSGVGGQFVAAHSSTNTVVEALAAHRHTTGTAANGIGVSLPLAIHTSTGSLQKANEIISKWTNATDGSRFSEFSITGVNSATTTTLLTLDGDGAAALNQYGSGTFTGTPAYGAAFDASGNIIEVAVPGGASVITPSTLTADQDDYNPTGFSTASVIRISGDATIRAITSMAAGTDGEEKKFINVGSNAIYFPGEHPDGTAANRISYHRDYLLLPKKAAVFMYDTIIDRWHIMSDEPQMTDHAVNYEWSVGSPTGGDWGNWATQAVSTGGTGSAKNNNFPASTNLQTGGAADGGICMYFTKTIQGYAGAAEGHIGSEFVWSLTQPSTETERFTVEFQVTDTPASTALTPNNTFGVRYSDNVNGGEFEGFSKNSTGTETQVDLNIAVSNLTLYRVGMYLDKANSEVRFYINGNFAGKIASTLGTNASVGMRAMILKSVGTTTRVLSMHSMNGYAHYTLTP